MGGLCAPETVQTKTQANLMGSELIISSGIKDVINLQKDELRVSGFPVDRSSIKSTSNSLILPVMKEINVELMVRFYLIYSFYINKYIKNTKEKSKYDEKFYELVAISHPSPEEQAKVTAFKQEYKKETNEAKKGLVLLKYVFSANFVIDNINRIPLFSKDPKDIGHLIFPLTVLHKSIKADFDRRHTKHTKPIYIIAPLDSTEEGYMKLIQNRDAYFSFSIFMKGFTNEKMARDKLKKLSSLPSKDKYNFFIVNFPYKNDKMQSEFNYGFSISEDKSDAIKEEGDVIFNIMNTFKVVGVQGRQYDLDYGYLPYLYYSKYVERSPVGDINLIKIFELCNAVSNHYLKSQSFLFRIIGGKEDSISTSNAIISMKENSKATTDIQRQNLINNHLDNNELDAALTATQQGESIMIKAKRLQVLYRQQKYEDAKNLISQISKTNPPKKDSKDSSVVEAYEMIEYISALIDMKQNAYKPALKKLTNLHKTMLARYGNDYEFIGRDVIRSMEECYKKGEEKLVESAITSSNWQLKNTGLNLSQIQ